MDNARVRFNGVKAATGAMSESTRERVTLEHLRTEWQRMRSAVGLGTISSRVGAN